MNEKYDYDAIIIGAGVSGLVCGCYLAKAGLKTLIVEKNAKPGGYCTSFTRQGFHFDACVYSLSSFRRNGSLGKLFTDLNLHKELEILRNEITDVIITPNYKVNLYCNVNNTIAGLQESFPKQGKALQNFFEFLTVSSVLSLSKLRSKTFKDILDYYFKDKELKTILSIVLLGYTGLPPSKLSAFVSAMIYREFIFDGGYYPLGGMQEFSNVLLSKFSQLGGNILLSSRVKSIKTKNDIVRDIMLENGEYFTSKDFVSACSVHETFFELIDRPFEQTKKKINTMDASLSAFLLYLGVTDLGFKNELKSHVWLIDNNYDDIEKIYSNLMNCKSDFVVMGSSSMKRKIISTQNKETLFLFTNMPFKNKLYWNTKNRNEKSSQLIKLASKFIKNITNIIELKVDATPFTLYKWTLNYKGAAYGWADTTSQFCNPSFSETTELKNLYLTGHWSNKSSGITSVVNSGSRTAETIIIKEKK